MSLLGDHFATCDRCKGYVITGTYRRTMRNSPVLCRCWFEEDVREDQLTVNRPDPFNAAVERLSEKHRREV